MTRPDRARGHRRALPLAALAGACLALASGCSTSTPTTGPEPAGALASPDHATGQQDGEAFHRSRKAEKILEEIGSELALDRAHASPARTPEPVIDRGPGPRTNLSRSYEVGEAPSEEAAPAEASMSTRSPEAEALPAPATLPPRDPRQVQRELVEELASMLRERADSPDWPIPPLIRLAALDLIEPGVFNSYYLAGSESGALSNLHPRDVELLAAWRDLFRRTREALDSQGENADLASVAQQFADRLSGQQALRIPEAKLCTRVDGFGLYRELKRYSGRYKLLVGRRHRLIVYVEVDRFSHRPATEDDTAGYAVELTQDLSLYHAGGTQDTLAWRKPNQEIYDFSRNKRRDFFVVQIIDLPETLTVGTYRLKVRLIDEGADPPAEAERIIPIDVVADVSALEE